MLVITLKILLAPLLVAAATLVGRRWGARVGGLVVALPVVAGPILLVIALQHGSHFAAITARHALLAVIALCGFTIVFALLSPSGSWPIALLGGWVVYGGLAAAASQVDLAVGPAAVLVLAAIIATRVGLDRQPPGGAAGTGEVPSWDLPLRMAVTLVLVVTVTSTAAATGPAVSGVLTPFPIATSVLAAFTLAQHGPAGANAFLRGFVTAMPMFAGFFAICAIALST
ncbi:MAG: hypothetical protein ACJ764_14020 [Solirubrobacteraceae bacterium]